MLFLGRYWSSLASGFSGVSILMYAAWVSVTIFVLIFVYSVRNPDHLKRVLKRISRWIDRRWHLRRLEQLLETIDREVDNFNHGLVEFVNHGKSGLVWGFFTALFWLSEFVIASMLLLGLDQQPYFIESFVVQYHRRYHDDPLTPGARCCGTQCHVILQPLRPVVDRRHLCPLMEADHLLPKHLPRSVAEPLDCTARISLAPEGSDDPPQGLNVIRPIVRSHDSAELPGAGCIHVSERYGGSTDRRPGYRE